MNPEVWGPHTWIFLHSISLNYPKCPTRKDKDNMRNFIVSLKGVLPCDNCKENFNSIFLRSWKQIMRTKNPQESITSLRVDFFSNVVMGIVNDSEKKKSFN